MSSALDARDGDAVSEAGDGLEDRTTRTAGDNGERRTTRAARDTKRDVAGDPRAQVPRTRRRRRPRFSRPAAPSILDPILATWERIDRGRRRIRPARPGAVLGVELRRHRRAEIRLADGTVVRPGDRVGELHLDNARIREGLARVSWLQVMSPARSDLDALARWSLSLPLAERPVAYHGATVLWPLAARVGFQVIQRPRTAYVRLDEWFLRWLLVHWSQAGRGRLEQGRGRLRSAEVWLSRQALERRVKTAG
jgi:hypothetical protein